MHISKILLGRFGEEKVCDLYRMNGFEIVQTNYANPHGKRLGEIDIVALKGRHIHFIEVKTRSGLSYGSGLSAIDGYKQRRMVRSAEYFLATKVEYASFQPHIDIATVEVNQVDKRLQRIKIYSDAMVDTQAEV